MLPGPGYKSCANVDIAQYCSKMKLTRTVLVEVAMMVILLCVAANLQEANERVKKQLSVFTVVKVG